MEGRLSTPLDGALRVCVVTLILAVTPGRSPDIETLMPATEKLADAVPPEKTIIVDWLAVTFGASALAFIDCTPTKNASISAKAKKKRLKDPPGARGLELGWELL